MTSLQNQSVDRARAAGGVAIAIASVAGVLLLGLVARFLLESELTWRCPSIVLFNLPCPSCGTTRALAALAQLQLLEALRLNPLLVLGFAAALATSLAASILKIPWRKLNGRCGWMLLGGAVFLNWIYLLFFLPR